MEQCHFLDPTFLPSTFDPNFHGSIENNSSLSRMPYRTLGKTGLNLSLLSYGGSSLAKFYGDEINQQSIDAIRSSIKSGVNYIDTSPWYGDSEKMLGEALNGVPRNAFYIGTKVGRNFTPGWENRFDFSRKAVLKNVENSLKLLGLNYVDIIQIHDLEFCLDPKIIIDETLPALESVVQAGKAKHIGITSYSLEAMKQAIESSPVKIDTILSYCRMNFHDTGLLDYVPYFQSKNIGIINAAPVAMGLYTARGPPDWHPASEKVKRLASNISEKYLVQSHQTIENAALGFGLHPENLQIATTLVSMPSEEILKNNLEIITTPRTSEDRKLYKNIVDAFKTNLDNESGHWEGKEVMEYKQAMGKC